MAVVKAIPPQSKEPSLKKVAAYCRVSAKSQEQLDSLAVQECYYEERIRANPNWKFAGIYSDIGSGTTTKGCRRFNVLLSACRRGKADMILVKSAHRFARNTVDTLETIWMSEIAIAIISPLVRPTETFLKTARFFDRLSHENYGLFEITLYIFFRMMYNNIILLVPETVGYRKSYRGKQCGILCASYGIRDAFYFFMLGGIAVNAEIFTFLRKFLAALYLIGVRDIPFSGEEYTLGVDALQNTLQDLLPEDKYDEISDVFIKTPVQEEYNQFRDMLISLNGDIIGFSAMKNPYWRTLSINMTRYYADKIMTDEDIGISDAQLFASANAFCDAAGVLVWERF